MSGQNDQNNQIKMLEQDKINLSDYSLDSFLIRSDHRSIWQVMQRIKSKRYLLERDFPQDDCRQRLLWDEVKQSKLIESVLMRIPLPPFYLAEQLDGTIVVVDGLQRLKTLYRYLNNEFALKNLSEELNGKRFKGQTEKVTHPENGPHPLTPSPNFGRGGIFGVKTPPLPKLGEGAGG